MAFKDFSDNQFIRAISSSADLVHLGSFKPAELQELQFARVKMYIHNVVLPNTTRMRVRVATHNNASSGYVGISDWRKLSDISNLGPYWIGWVAVEFPSLINLSSFLEYHMFLELDNYTPNGTITWIGAVYDWPFPVHGAQQTNYYDHPIAVQLASKYGV